MAMLHDIRGSMVSTAATLKLLGRGNYGEVGDKARVKLQEISNRMDKLIGLTEEFVDKAISKTPPGELEKEMLDLDRDVVDPVLQELAESIRDHQVNLENRLAFHLGPITVKGSRVWLKSVFRNLLKNAVEHGEPGGTVIIDWQAKDDSCRLNVYNSGSPIPAEAQSMLFSSFTPRIRRTRGKKSGLGLGLYLSRDIVQSHGGDIWYESKIDGSNFVVSLPNN
jgi:signal transduction histidine kinase